MGRLHRRWLMSGAAASGLLILGASLSCVRTQPSAPPAAAPEIMTTEGGVEMVRIPAGRFLMGSERGEPDEAPAHQVELDAFWMDRYEVTQAAYARIDPVNGSHFKGPQLPTEMISWGKAALYCNLRSEAEGLEPCYNELGECNFEANGYRLPTEAEWEYACRAGSRGDYSFGSDPRLLEKYAWYADNAGKKTHPVGKKLPNAWGLFDMEGNVAEWCNDFYGAEAYGTSERRNPRGPASGDRKVLRGGHWGASAKACRASARAAEEPGFSDACFARDAIGFRCVRRAAPQEDGSPASGRAPGEEGRPAAPEARETPAAPQGAPGRPTASGEPRSDRMPA